MERTEKAMVGVIVVLILTIFLFPLILMWCWNFIMPLLFALPTINYWQAWVMSILAELLFKPIVYNRLEKK